MKFFCPLLKISATQTGKFLTFQNFLLRMKKNKRKNTPSQSTMKYGSDNRPKVRGIESPYSHCTVFLFVEELWIRAELDRIRIRSDETTILYYLMKTLRYF